MLIFQKASTIEAVRIVIKSIIALICLIGIYIATCINELFFLKYVVYVQYQHRIWDYRDCYERVTQFICLYLERKQFNVYKLI